MTLRWFARLGILLLVCGCQSVTPRTETAENSDSPFAAASGVVARQGPDSRGQRVIPLSPMTGDVELLYGNPETPGEPFVMRIRELPGAMVPPHTHPVDEHITVVQGTWYFAIGSEYRPEQLKELKTGSYAFAPAGASMFGFSPNGAIVQVHGVGPFRIHCLGGLNTLDDKDAATVFRFARGARVQVGTRTGVIAEGYCSGDVKQYEIETIDGERFMAEEQAVQAQ